MKPKRLDTTKFYFIPDNEVNIEISKLAGRNGLKFCFSSYDYVIEPYPVIIYYENHQWHGIHNEEKNDHKRHLYNSHIKNSIDYETGLKATEVYPEFFI